MGNLVSGLGLSHGWTLCDRQSPPCRVAAATLKSPYSPRAVIRASAARMSPVLIAIRPR
jgi:hypothetical protein